jgi:hypothetical protein
MTISKDTGKKMVKVGLLIITPTIILILVLIFLYWRKKKKEKNLLEKGGDTAGMSNYRISIPFKYQPKLFINGDFFNAISEINYSLFEEKVENEMILVDILMKPEDLGKMKEILDGLNSEITIQAK